MSWSYVARGGSKFKKLHIYQCPCGYKYAPEKGDTLAGWSPGTSFKKLRESGLVGYKEAVMDTNRVAVFKPYPFKEG